MAKTVSNLRLKQMDVKLANWRRLADAAPKGGWLRAIRETLGMTTAQLARRLGVAQQAIAKFERNEAAGKITLASLARVAEALECRVTYAVVPAKPLGEMRRTRALALAASLTKPVAHSMRLEAQGISDRETRRQRKELAEELLRGSSRKLWR
jgi:predicted DNA-binding mobile mystery protein A